MMKNNKADKALSIIMANCINSKADDCFWNAYMGMYIHGPQKPSNVRYCFGCYRNTNSKERFVYEHAWLELNGIIYDPSLSVFAASKLEDYIYIELFNVSIQEIESWRAHIEVANKLRYSGDERIASFSILGYIQYDCEKYDDFVKGMNIIAAENYTCIDRNSKRRIGFYNEMKPVDDLAFEKMLIKKPSDETV